MGQTRQVLRRDWYVGKVHHPLNRSQNHSQTSHSKISLWSTPELFSLLLSGSLPSLKSFLKRLTNLLPHIVRRAEPVSNSLPLRSDTAELSSLLSPAALRKEEYENVSLGAADPWSQIQWVVCNPL